MRFHVVLRYVAITLLLNAIFLFLSTVISALYSDSAFFPLLYAGLIAALFGIFPLIFIPLAPEISNMEGLLIVVYSWLTSCLVGVIPYVLWGGEFTFSNAWFESVSGFTTTGSSILTDIEALPLGLLFWRSATHWIGGIGIIIFALAVVPPLGISRAVLYRAEISEQALYSFSYSARRSIQILLRVYITLTLGQIVALLFCGMNLFDAVTTSFGTIATGGFSPKNESIAHYNSTAVEIVTMIFMIASGIHFALLFSALYGKIRDVWNSSVTRLYITFLLIGVLITAINLHGLDYTSWFEALRYSAFQIISIGTSTGFATADSSLWPPLSQLLLLFFTFQCACAGSTSGGIKVDRSAIFLKSVIRKIQQIRHPRAVIPIRLEGKTIDDQVVDFGVLYISSYIFIVFLSAGLLCAFGVDLLSAFSGSAATMGNVGPGLGSVGSMSSFAHIPTAAKWILSVTMLLGRLEIYGLILCFVPIYWK